jgi:hypothetical protein
LTVWRSSINIQIDLPMFSEPLTQNADAAFNSSSPYSINASEPADEAIAVALQAAFAVELDLPHVHRGEIEGALRADSGNAALRLVRLAEALHAQTCRAVRVFELLDVAGKGVVVVEDLRRVAPDILGDGNGSVEPSGSAWKDADLVEMVTLVDRSGDGILTKDDVIRIARKVGL